MQTHVQSQSDSGQSEGGYGCSVAQIDFSNNSEQHQTHSDTDEELDHSFAGNVFRSCSSFREDEWIIDTGSDNALEFDSEPCKQFFFLFQKGLYIKQLVLIDHSRTGL